MNNKVVTPALETPPTTAAAASNDNVAASGAPVAPRTLAEFTSVHQSAPAAAPAREDDMAMLHAKTQFLQAYVTKDRSKHGTADVSAVSATLENISGFHAPGIAKDDIAGRIEHWIQHSGMPDGPINTAREFLSFVKNGFNLTDDTKLSAGDTVVAMPKAGVAPGSAAVPATPRPTDPGAVYGNMVSQGLGSLAQTTEVAIGSAADGLKSLASAAASPFRAMSQKNLDKRIARATEASLNETMGMEKLLDQHAEQLSAEARKVASVPPGEARDKMVDQMGDRVSAFKQDLRSYAERMSRMSADENSKFRKTPEEIEEKVQKVGSSVNDALHDAQRALAGDARNEEAMAKQRKQLQEMLERIKEMVKSVFSGFRNGKDNKAAPKP